MAIGFALAVCAAAVVLTASSPVSSDKPKYKIVFDNAFGLVQGGDFRVGGVKAGKTTKFEVTHDKPPKAEVTAEITEPGLGDFRKDASCTIKPQSLIGEYYVDCQPGTSRERLPKDGSGTVPVRQTESTIPTDLVNDILRRPYRERLRLLISTLGAGLAGRPDDLQQVLRRAHPGLRETSKVLRILGRQNRIIENFITDSDRVVDELEGNKRDVARWVSTTANAAEISATRRQQIAQSFHKLPAFLDELRPTMRNLGRLSDEQTPLLADLQKAAPDLDTFFRRLGPFSRASRPAVRSLGHTSVAGTRALRKGKEEIEELRKLAPETGPTGKPLRQFLDSFDSRQHAVDVDPRAKASGPPAPDKTHITDEGGFTGAEAFWNYWLWQGLSLNGFDKIGHILRVSLTATKCASYVNSADDPQLLKDCNQWLGPYQPGINAKDFTDPNQTNNASLARAGKPAKRIGERRGPGQPDAGPLPGQRDISKPHVVLPPALQQLIDRLGPKPSLPARPSAPTGGTSPSDVTLLDYLLSP
jgi:ABC-type transporter Mla subunit MlaD